MKRFALLLLLTSGVLLAQAQIAPAVFRIPSSQLLQLVQGLPPASDVIEVIVQTNNPATTSIRVTLTYSDTNGNPVVLVSERPVFTGATGIGFDIHTFNLPSAQAPIVSVRQTELMIATDQTYTGF